MYIAAESFHFSGVLAVVSGSLFQSTRNQLFLSPGILPPTPPRGPAAAPDHKNLFFFFFFVTLCHTNIMTICL